MQASFFTVEIHNMHGKIGFSNYSKLNGKRNDTKISIDACVMSGRIHEIKKVLHTYYCNLIS